MIWFVFALASVFGYGVAQSPLKPNDKRNYPNCTECDFKIPGVGFLPDDKYAVIYFRCELNPSAVGGFTRILQCCPKGQFWHQNLLTCTGDNVPAVAPNGVLDHSYPVPPCPPWPPITTTPDLTCPFNQTFPASKDYFLKSNGKKLSCRAGMIFEEVPCTCLPTVTPPPRCDGIIHFEFTDSWDSDNCNIFVKGTPHGNPVRTDCAACFDGVDDYITFNYLNNWFINNPFAESFSVSAWAKEDSLMSLFGGLVCNGDCHAYWSYCMGLSTSTFDAGIFTTGDAGRSPLTFPVVPNIQDWILYTVTYDGTTARFYINDQLQATTHVTNGPIRNVQTASSIGLVCLGDHLFGPNQDYNFFHGCIDDVRIYTKVLTQPDVDKLYADKRTPC